MPKFQTAENHLLSLVAEKYGLPAWPIDEVVQADHAMLATEKEQIMTHEPAPWTGMASSIKDFTIQGLLPNDAKALFLSRFEELSA